MGWIDEVADRATVHDVIRVLGLTEGRRGSVGPCPLCNAKARGKDDRRGPLGVRRDDRGWQCFACDGSGDALELAALVWTGKRLREMTPVGRDEVRNRAAAQGWCTEHGQDSPGRTMISPPSQATPRRRQAPAQKGWSVRRLDPKQKAGVKPPPVKDYPFGWQPDLPERCAAALWAPEGAQVLAYLEGRGFGEETLLHWNVGAYLVHKDGRLVEQYVALPIPRQDGTIIGMRFRSVPGTCLRCGGAGCPRPRGRRPTCKDGEVTKAFLRCTAQETTLFGVHALDPDTESDIVVVEGELDVLAMWQYGLRLNVVSHTAGATAEWTDEMLDVVEPYRHFLLCHDDDEKGTKGVTKLSARLGPQRCSRVLLPETDAAECMKACVAQATVHAALDNAQPMLNMSFARVDAFTGKLEDLIANPAKMRGKPTGSSKLDAALGGWPYGLVVVTGDTAAGKTSFTTWAGLEQALRHVPVLLTSFEQQPIGLVQKLLRAQLGGDFTAYSKEQRRQGMQALGGLPLYLLDHYGELSVPQLTEALDYANRRLGVTFAVVDHLGFLVRGADDERKAIEEAVRGLALFGVQREITIVLICHPNNLSIVQQRRVQLGDLKGASAIRQDAHVGLVVERLLPGKAVKHPAAAVYADKVRSEWGMQGARCTMFYDPEACVYADTWEATPMGMAGASGGFRVPPPRRR